MFDDDGKKGKDKPEAGPGDEGGGGGGGEKNNRNNKGVDFKSSRIVFLLIISFIVLLIFMGKGGPFASGTTPAWNEFRTEVEEGRFKEIRFTGREVSAIYAEGNKGKTEVHLLAPSPMPDTEYNWFVERAKEKGFKISYQEVSALGGILMSIVLPMVCFSLLMYFLVFRQMRGPGGPGGVLSFGKSRAVLINKEKTKKTFKDVAGVEEAKAEVEEIVGFLKNPKKFQRLGGRIPKGVLLIGPPGTGKTLLAKAIAGEADVPFFSISGSDFVEMFVGVGASRVRDMFQTARENSPCIIFLDEIDAVGRKRGAGFGGGGHDEREQTLNEILVQMDGMESDDKIIVMAATNRPDVLDAALLRPGRFDRHVTVDLPDVKGREEILKVHAKKVKLSPTVDLLSLAKSTPGSSGADLENIINEAALIAVTKEKDAIDLSDLDEARDKVAWGREKRSRVMEESERWITAYHEAGHALLSYIIPECEKPSKVSIIPRGPYLGVTMITPSKDVYGQSEKQLLGRIKMCYGGRIAEKMFTSDITTGAKGDIDQATAIARRMVCEFGMSSKLGPIRYTEDEENIYLGGKDVMHQRQISEATAIAVDDEVRRIVNDSYVAAEELLEQHREKVELIARALMEHEVINGEEIQMLMETGKIEMRKPVKTVEHRPLPRSKVEPKAGAKAENFPGILSGTPQPA